MFNKLNIFEIRSDAIKAVRRDSSDISFVLIYYGLPFVCALTLHIICYEIKTDLFGNLISGISLFAALLFSIIFVVSNNLNTRKEQYKSHNEEDLRYLKNYKDFANSLVALISYTIVKAIIIVVILIVSDAYFDYLENKTNITLRIIWDLLVFLLVQFLLYIIIILREMYLMQYEDINNGKYQ
jgi:hypothetical protein